MHKNNLITIFLILFFIVAINLMSQNIPVFLSGYLPAPASCDVVDVYQKDVISFFNLGDKYDTPLKKQNFKSSQLYKTKVDSLSKLQAIYKKNKYYVSMDVDYGEYDISNKCFRVEYDVVDCLGTKTINGYYFTTIPSRKTLLMGIPKYYLSIPVSSTQAADAENEDGTVYVLFSIAGVSGFKGLSLANTIGGGYGFRDVLYTLPFATTVEVIALDRHNNVLSDKKYFPSTKK